MTPEVGPAGTEHGVGTDGGQEEAWSAARGEGEARQERPGRGRGGAGGRPAGAQHPAAGKQRPAAGIQHPASRVPGTAARPGARASPPHGARLSKGARLLSQDREGYSKSLMNK